jgi:hypothetical protein
VPFIDLHRILPWGVAGFVVNAITGMVFFVVVPHQYAENPSFHFKVIFMLLGGATILYLTLFDEPWELGPAGDASTATKAIAAAQLFLWAGVVYFGRMLPYLGQSI